MTAVAPFSKGVTEAAARGWDPISANFLMPAWVKSHWPKYVEGCERGGRAADPANWRVAKSVFVAKDAATAKAYATDPDGPYVYYYRSLFTKLKTNGRIELFKTRRDQPDDEVTLEMICDKLIIYGTPESVADQLLAFQDEVGKFGTLLYAGKDWKDRELGRQSMILMAEKVMPRVNAGTSKQAKAAEWSAAIREARRGSDRSHSLSGANRPAETQLPGGKKLAVWVILNVEEWRIENAMPRTVLSPPMGQPLLPDVPNWSWHEYGMRAGFWRQFKALTDRNMPVTLALNANVCSSYPRVASAAREAGFEFMGHGFVQGPMHKLDNQADAIKRPVETIAKFTGKPPTILGKPGPDGDRRDARSAAP